MRKAILGAVLVGCATAAVAMAGPYSDTVKKPVTTTIPDLVIRKPPGEPYGAIGEKWRQLGGAAGVMGKPLIDERPATNGGRYVEFEWGFIFWRGDLGAHNVLYPMSRKWVGMGRETGFGYPVTDTISSPAAAATTTKTAARFAGRKRTAAQARFTARSA